MVENFRSVAIMRVGILSVRAFMSKFPIVIPDIEALGQ